jgi:hypothetical protein
VYSLIGVFAAAEGIYYMFVDHTLSDRLQDLAWIAAGVSIILVGTYAVRRLGTNEVVRMRLEDQGPSLVHVNGTVQRWSWTDPDLKIDVCHLAGSPDQVLPKDDARRFRRDWVDAFSPPSRMIKLETTLPRTAADALVEAARGHGAAVRTIQVAFYWASRGPHNPGELDHEVDGHLTRDHSLNGEITQIRPASIGWNNRA